MLVLKPAFGYWTLLATSNQAITPNYQSVLQVTPQLKPQENTTALCTVKFKHTMSVLHCLQLTHALSGTIRNDSMLQWDERRVLDVTLLGIGISTHWRNPQQPLGRLRKIETDLLNDSTLHVQYEKEIYLFARSSVVAKPSLLMPLPLFIALQVLGQVYLQLMCVIKDDLLN